MKDFGFGKLCVTFAALIVLVSIVLLNHANLQKPQLRPQNLSPAIREAGQDSAATHFRQPRPIVAQKRVAIHFDWRDLISGSNAPPKLPREEVERYLERHKREATSLLAAFHALGDTNYLREAAANFPNNPRVELAVLKQYAVNRDTPGILEDAMTPEEKRRWLELLKESSPDNSLANYLSALDYFDNRETNAAINELLAAATKSTFNDYILESKLDEEELNLETGRSLIESILSATGWEAELAPELGRVKGVAHDIANLQKQYLASGDTASAANLVQMGFALANQLRDGGDAKFLDDQLVADSIEVLMLHQLDQNIVCDFLGGKTPAQHMSELDQHIASIRALAQSFREIEPNMTNPEWQDFSERTKLLGEVEAMRWAVQQHTKSTPNTAN